MLFLLRPPPRSASLPRPKALPNEVVLLLLEPTTSTHSFPCAPTTLAFSFFRTHTPGPRQLQFLSIWKALSGPPVTDFPFSFRYLLKYS